MTTSREWKLGIGGKPWKRGRGRFGWGVMVDGAMRVPVEGPG